MELDDGHQDWTIAIFTPAIRHGRDGLGQRCPIPYPHKKSSHNTVHDTHRVLNLHTGPMLKCSTTMAVKQKRFPVGDHLP